MWNLKVHAMRGFASLVLTVVVEEKTKQTPS